MRRLLPALLLLAGCQSQVAPTTQTPTSGTVQTRPIELVPVSAAGLDAALADLKGKVVLLDVWFLGCKPCVKKFPTFVELHNRYAADGLVCVSVNRMSTELAEQPKVLAFLQAKQARFPNYILKDSPEQLEGWIDTRVGTQVTPAYLLLDREGKKVPLDLDATSADVEAIVRQLLARK